ncbi:MAG: hypothetical protein PF489_11225 [Salinivirgaceae bacterium]|jgi:hypothetical protein|nr:hypothetical protein [Salinivirgaceae bacterium]
MKRIKFIFIVLLISMNAFGQQKAKYVNSYDNSTFLFVDQNRIEIYYKYAAFGGGDMGVEQTLHSARVFPLNSGFYFFHENDTIYAEYID